MTSQTLKKAQDLSNLIERYDTLLRLLSDNTRETKGGAIPNLTPALGQALNLNVVKPADLLPFIGTLEKDAKKLLAETKEELEKL